jgi:hypothetical protein
MTFEASAEIYDRHVGRYVPRLSAELVSVALPGGAVHADGARLVRARSA